jgi:CelD/BcsL family acetyltransferase involved in cellulose biosynthesis
MKLSRNMSEMEIEYITEWETIYSENFQQQWLEWLEKAENSHVFFHPALCMAWLETYRPLRNLKPIFVIGRTADTVIFLPMVLWRRNWKNAFQKLLIPVGYSDFDYHAPLICSKNGQCIVDVDQFFIEFIKSLQNYIQFDFLSLNGLQSPSSNRHIFKENDICPFVDLKRFNNSDDFFSSLSSSVRGDVRRQMRRLGELGEIEFSEYKNLPSVNLILAEFLKNHSKRWPNAYKAPNFHQNILNKALLNGVAHFSTLALNDEIISWHLGFEYGNTYYYYMPAINEKWSRFSPGKIHLNKLIERAIQRRLEVFDHLRGEENYKAGWSNGIKELYELNLPNFKIGSKLRNYLIKIKNN